MAEPRRPRGVAGPSPSAGPTSGTNSAAFRRPPSPPPRLPPGAAAPGGPHPGGRRRGPAAGGHAHGRARATPQEAGAAAAAAPTAAFRQHMSGSGVNARRQPRLRREHLRRGPRTYPASSKRARHQSFGPNLRKFARVLSAAPARDPERDAAAATASSRDPVVTKASSWSRRLRQIGAAHRLFSRTQNALDHHERESAPPSTKNSPKQSTQAWDDRSKCQSVDCRRPLRAGDARIGKRPPSARLGQGKTRWYHLECVFASFRRACRRSKTITRQEDVRNLELLAPEDREKVKQMIDAWNAELRAATAADQPQPPVQPPTAPTVTGSSEDDDKAESASESEEDDDDVRPLPFLASIAPDGRSKCQYVHCPTREIRAGAARLGARPPSPRPGGNGRVQWFHVDCAFAATAWAGTRCRRSGPPDGLDALSPPDRARLLRLVADAKKRRRKADNGSERRVKQKSNSSGDAQPPAAPPPMSRGHWSEAEHAKFVAALAVHGRDWVKVAYAVGSRTLAQVRSHAQKHFLETKPRNAPRGSATRRARRSSPGPSPRRGRAGAGAAAPTARTRRRC